MTEVTLKLNPCGVLAGFQLVVCRSAAHPNASSALSAAESALLQALCCRLARAGADRLEDLAVDGVPGRGWCAVTARPTAAGLEYVRGAFELAGMGFSLLQQQYPGQLVVRPSV